MSLVDAAPRIGGRPTQNTGTPRSSARRSCRRCAGYSAAPFLGAELAAGRARACAIACSARRRRRRLWLPLGRRLLGVRRAARPPAAPACGGRLRLRRRLRPGRGRRRRRAAPPALLADRLAVVEADHHHDEFRLLGRDDFARDLRPVDVAARLVADQAGIGACLRTIADLGRFGERVLEPVGRASRPSSRRAPGRWWWPRASVRRAAPARASNRPALRAASRSRCGRLAATRSRRRTDCQRCCRCGARCWRAGTSGRPRTAPARAAAGQALQAAAAAATRARDCTR